MKVLGFGDITDGGNTVFTASLHLDGGPSGGARLVATFAGVIRVDNPQRHLQPFLDALPGLLQGAAAGELVLDFTGLRFCNSNGFYVIMDLAELLYGGFPGPVRVLRIADDDWQQETLPILLDFEELGALGRTTFL